MKEGGQAGDAAQILNNTSRGTMRARTRVKLLSALHYHSVL